MRMLKQKLRDFVDARIGARLDHRIAGLANTEFLGNLPLFGPHGVMLSTATLSPEEKARRAIYWQYRERARIALSVAGNYRGGDYLEFGSDGMGTFRNFLSAYDLNGLDRHFPQTRFYAFDIFGRVDSREMDEYERTHFGHWEGEDKREQAHAFLDQHNLFRNRCEVHAGFFTDTVPPILERYRGVDAEKIGFAFLDCNITTSYELRVSVRPVATLCQFARVHIHGRVLRESGRTRTVSRICCGVRENSWFRSRVREKCRCLRCALSIHGERRFSIHGEREIANVRMRRRRPLLRSAGAVRFGPQHCLAGTLNWMSRVEA